MKLERGLDWAPKKVWKFYCIRAIRVKLAKQMIQVYREEKVPQKWRNSRQQKESLIIKDTKEAKAVIDLVWKVLKIGIKHLQITLWDQFNKPKSQSPS